MLAGFIIALGVLIAFIGFAGVLAVAVLDMQDNGLFFRETLPFWGIAAVGVVVAATPFWF